MLNQRQFEAWCRRLGLLLAAIVLIGNIRVSPPSRRVRSGLANVSGRYPSRKMKFAVQFESHTVELAAILLMEFDPSVLEYYDQVSPIKLSYTNAAGRHVVAEHTPDFFLLRPNVAGWKECKTESDLAKLAEKDPSRYVRDGNGWRCPPGEAFAKELGLQYWLQSDAEINPVLVRNARYLERYCDVEPTEDGPMRAALRQIVVDHPGTTIRELLRAAETLTGGGEAVEPGAMADVLNHMLLVGELYVDLERTLIDDQAHARVFVDAAVAGANPIAIVRPEPAGASGPVIPTVGARFDWNGAVVEIVNIGKSTVSFVGEAEADGTRPIRELTASQVEAMVASGALTFVGTPTGGRLAEVGHKLAAAAPRDWNEALARHDRISPVLDGEAPAASLKRNEKRWLRDYRVEDRRSGHGCAGLLPGRRAGNRTNHAVEVSDDDLTEMLVKLYKKASQLSETGILDRVRAQLVEDGVAVLPSSRRCRRLLRLHKTHELDSQRLGRRAAYGSQPVIWRLSASTPPHGVRPWEIVHCDHTLLDVQVVDDADRTVVLGRPWFTVLFDAYSRCVLAFALTFDPPSYRSDMLVLRECARRHGRLPETIVTDGGSDFQSIYYERLLAFWKITKKTRPPARARFGSVIERFFRTNDTTFVHELQGQTTASKNPRSMSPEVDPERLAIWDLISLQERMEKWLYEVYDTRFHSGIGTTPRSRYAIGIELAGARAIRSIPRDDIAALFLPTSDRGTLKNSARRGLRFRGGSYWNRLLRSPRFDGVSVAFVYDPLDVRYILAFVDGSWIRCDARDFDVPRPVSEKELGIAATQQEAHRRQTGAAARASHLELGRFLRETDAAGELLAQRRKDDAVRKIAAGNGLRSAPEPIVQASAEEQHDARPAPRTIPFRLTKLEDY